MKRSMAERIGSKIRLVGDCWEWTGYIHRSGYGQMSGDYSAVYAHRAAYETFIGLVPNGLELDHVCENRACVNPEHLQPVTRQENCQRGHDRLGRRYRGDGTRSH